MYRYLILFCVAASLAAAQAQPWTSSRPDGHAPLGVMGEHTHAAGEFMLSYRFMHMAMKGNLDGSDAVDAAAIVATDGPYGFMVTPVEMPMQMHMFSLMYAPTDALTLMAMVPAVFASMDHVSRMSVASDPNAIAFTTESGGLSDVSLTALYRLATPEGQHVHANLGVGFPTGSIDEMDVTPMSEPNETQLPYSMQTGGGTFDVRPGLTYLGQTQSWSWGAQAGARVRLGENDQDYRLGHVYHGTVWGARKLARSVSASLRTEVRNWGDVDGASPLFEMAVAGNVVPTVFPELRGGTRLDVAAGINVYVPAGTLRGLRFAAEAVLPVYQSLHGPQLETDLHLMVGVQYAPPRH